MEIINLLEYLERQINCCLLKLNLNIFLSIDIKNKLFLLLLNQN